MAQFSVKASFDGSELVQGFKGVKTELNGLKTAGEQAGKSLDSMLQAKNSSSDYRRQLSLITRELTDLTINYRRLSEAEQQSEFGQGLKLRIDELTAKASEFKDAMLDVQQSISESASDTANWDAFQSLIDITASSLQTFAGIAGLSEESTAALNKSIGIMMTTGAAANTVIKVGNALQKTSALMLGVSRVQNAAAAAAITVKTAAEGKSIIATKAATVAQKAFNVVANANPYVLLATAILGVGVALAGFIKHTKNAEKEQEEYNKRIEEQKEKENARKDVVNTSVGEIIGKYKLLQYHWKELSSDQEKNRWISENQSAFNDLGIAINDVNTAQRVFVENSDLVIQALKDQAKARALAQVYEEAIVAQYKADQKLTDEKEVAKKKYPDGYRPSNSEAKAAGLNDKTDYYTVYAENSLWDQWVNDKPRGEMKPTDAVDYSGATKLQTNYLKEHQQAADQAAADVAKIEQAYTDAQKAAAASAQAVKDAGVKFNPTGSSGSGSTGGTTTKPDIFAEDSLRAAQQEVQTLQDKLNRMSPNDAAFATTLQQLNEAKAKVKDLQDKMREPVTPLTETEKLVKTYEDANKQINDIVKQYKIGILDEETAKQQINRINEELQKLGLNPIEIKLKTTSEVERGRTLEYRNQQASKAQNALVEYEAGIITYGVAKQAVDEINADLEKLGLKPLELKIDDGSLAAFEERYESTMNVMDSSASVISSVGQAFGAVVSAINDENTALGAVVGTLDQGAKSWLEWGVNSVNTIAQVLPQIASIIMAQQAQALAGGIASGAALPFPANMAVIASVVAALLAMFASLPKFATGGIVNGSLIGDMNLARVNGGEMILNGRQQTNLFRMLDQNRLPQFGGGLADVNFRIKGDTLIGVIDNYNKKHGRG